MLRGIALGVVLATTSAAAQAATYLAQLTGTVTSQIDPGFDPNISVGDKVVMTARFDDSRIFDDGTLRAATVYGLPTSGAQFWNVKLNGLTWQTSDDELDGQPSFFVLPDPKGHELSMPYFELLPGGKVGSPHFLLTRINTDQIPRFYSSGGATGQILPGDFLYGNTTQTPGFNVTWDLANSKLSTVPEPSVWALTIVGFGLVGAASRKRSRMLRTISA
jgi:PEP-CTERM putative exosortase interaction domain